MENERDPLTCIPRPEVVRTQLGEAEVRVKRLRILLSTSEKIYRHGPRNELHGGNPRAA